MLARIIMILAVLGSSMPAQAEHWQIVAESVDGFSLQADTDSITLVGVPTVDKPREAVQIEGNMMYTGMPMWMARIDLRQCTADKKGELLNRFSDGSTKIYSWDATGRKMYDAQGSFLCSYTVEILHKYDKAVQPVSKKYMM